MPTSTIDIQQFVVLDHDSLGFPEYYSRSLQLFKDSVVMPSLAAIGCKIEENIHSTNCGAVFFNSHLADLFQATVESYLLTVQSMWERGLRGLLANRERKLCNAKEIHTLQKCNWSSGNSSIQYHFERLLGIPITIFDSYDDLNFLQNLGNAIRHGDGPSAKRVYELAPALWFGWLSRSTTIQIEPLGIANLPSTSQYPSFDHVTLKETVLQQMLMSVSNFWEDLEYLRCNSFSNRHESLIRHLETLSEKRRSRKRVWSP